LPWLYSSKDSMSSLHRSHVTYSSGSLAVSNRAPCYRLHWLMTCASKSSHFVSFTWYLTFVSHYIDDDVIVQTCVTCQSCRIFMKNNECFGHVTDTLFSNVAFISNRIDDVTAKHIVSCGGMSFKNLGLLLNLIKPSALAKCKRRIFVVLNYIDVIARHVK